LGDPKFTRKKKGGRKKRKKRGDKNKSPGKKTESQKYEKEDIQSRVKKGGTVNKQKVFRDV